MEYNIRVYKPELKQEEGKINNLKGFATITFDEAFCVKSLAIKESSKGNLYLDMPRYRDYETGEYVPFFRFTDKEFQKEVLDTVREAYENMTETKTDCKGSWGEEELYYNLSVNPVQGSDTFKADVAIRLQDVLAIQQLHVIQAWNGKTFVGMPQKNSAKGEREDIAHAVNAEFKADLESAIMDEYNKKMEYAKSQKQQDISKVERLCCDISIDALADFQKELIKGLPAWSRCTAWRLRRKSRYRRASSRRSSWCIDRKSVV